MLSACRFVGSEEHPQVADHQLGHLERGEVAAAVELGPVHDVVVVALGQRPDRLEVVLEDRDAGPAVADLRLARRSAARRSGSATAVAEVLVSQ